MQSTIKHMTIKSINSISSFDWAKDDHMFTFNHSNNSSGINGL